MQGVSPFKDAMISVAQNFYWSFILFVIGGKVAD